MVQDEGQTIGLREQQLDYVLDDHEKLKTFTFTLASEYQALAEGMKARDQQLNVLFTHVTMELTRLSGGVTKIYTGYIPEKAHQFTQHEASLHKFADEVKENCRGLWQVHHTQGEHLRDFAAGITK